MFIVIRIKDVKKKKRLFSVFALTCPSWLQTVFQFPAKVVKTPFSSQYRNIYTTLQRRLQADTNIHLKLPSARYISLDAVVLPLQDLSYKSKR